MASNPLLAQIAQLLSPTTAAWSPGPFTPPFNPNAPPPGSQPQPQQQEQPAAVKPSPDGKPKGKLARVGNALSSPSLNSFFMGMAGALNRPRGQGESEMQQLTSGLMGGYGGLQNLAMMQEAARQQQFKERLAMAEAIRLGAATQSQVGLQGAQTAQTAAETGTIPAKEGRAERATAVSERGMTAEERRTTVAERGATAEERRTAVAERGAAVTERRAALEETQMMERTAQAKKDYDLDVAKLREAQAARMDANKIAQIRVEVDKKQVAIAGGRLKLEADKLKADLEARGETRKAALVNSAREATESQVKLMNSTLAEPMTAEQVEQAFVSTFNRYVKQLSLGTGIPMNTEAFGGQEDTRVVQWEKGPDGKPRRVGSAGDQ